MVPQRDAESTIEKLSNEKVLGKKEIKRTLILMTGNRQLTFLISETKAETTMRESGK